MWRVERTDSDVVVLTIRRRPELSRDDGAADVKRTVPIVLGLVDDRGALVVDLRDAPPAWGPLTHKALVDAIAAWDVARRPVAVVAGAEAIARLGARSLVQEAAPRAGKVCATIDEAIEHATSPASPTETTTSPPS